MPVDDPGAVEVVRGELTADAVAGQDPDAETTHLSRHMPEHDVVVVQLHAKHRVRQGLDHLALEFNLVLLGHALKLPAWEPRVRPEGGPARRQPGPEPPVLLIGGGVLPLGDCCSSVTVSGTDFAPDLFFFGFLPLDFSAASLLASASPVAAYFP